METSDTSNQHTDSQNQSGRDSYWDILTESITASGKRCRRELRVKTLARKAKRIGIRCIAGKKGQSASITCPMVFRLGLALTGLLDDLEPGAVGLMARAETKYLKSGDPKSLIPILDQVLERGIVCFLFVHVRRVPDFFLEFAESRGVPVFISSKTDLEIVPKLEAHLETELAPAISFHGNLLVISGMGVLILGKSGIGKSDDALDLIKQGHQLVADDVVNVHLNREGKLIGQSDEFTRYHMDIRGLGIVNIKDMFGITSVLDNHPIELVLYLETWDPNKNYACFQQKEEIEILGAKRPLLRLPVSPGRNLENLIEVAVKTFVLKAHGFDAEKQLSQRLSKKLKRRSEEQYGEDT